MSKDVGNESPESMRARDNARAGVVQVHPVEHVCVFAPPPLLSTLYLRNLWVASGDHFMSKQLQFLE